MATKLFLPCETVKRGAGRPSFRVLGVRVDAGQVPEVVERMEEHQLRIRGGNK